MASLGKITRRAFLGVAAVAAGGVAFGYWYVNKPYSNPLENDLADGEATFNAFVKIASDNTITVIAPRAEMGQGISTTLAAFVAEELNVSLDKVTVEHGPASWAYFNEAMLEDAGPFPFFAEGILAETVRTGLGAVGKVLGLQATGGSASARDGFEKMRQAGAAARHVLIEAGAARLGVQTGELVAENGAILHKASGKSATYGELAQAAAKISPPTTVTLKDKADWTILGKPQQRVDMLAKVTGAPIFGVDVMLPDMLFGTVKMNPVFWQKPANADLSKAQAVPGVIKIVPIDSTYGHGFGVIAENTWAAFKAADLIEADWGKPDYPADGPAVEKALDAALAAGGGFSLRNDGDVETQFADAPREKIVEAEYSVPFLAHACMEPMNATAHFKDGRLDIWSPNQFPTVSEQLCASAIGIETESAKIHTTFLGGGFGRREMDFSIYASIMAKEAGGRPVKVIWTREEDIRHDVYRPAAKAKFRARLGDDGLPVAFDGAIACPSIVQSVLRRTFPSISPAGPDGTITHGAHDQPYTIPNYRISGIPADIAVPVGFWRSVGNSYTSFFHESFMDEIALAGKTDVIDLHKRLMADYPAAVTVVEKVAEMAKWGENPGAGKAKGFAFTLAFGSWVGQIVQIADTPGGIRLEKVWIAADVGMALDPGILEAQITSGAIFGLSSAMMQEITITDGKVDQSNFHDFDAMRIHQCPEFEVAILENYHKMGGAGEIGTPPAVAALANAVFALTGKRIRTLPLSREVSFA